jgi:hypothetical protein
MLLKTINSVSSVGTKVRYFQQARGSRYGSSGTLRPYSIHSGAANSYLHRHAFTKSVAAICLTSIAALRHVHRHLSSRHENSRSPTSTQREQKCESVPHLGVIFQLRSLLFFLKMLYIYCKYKSQFSKMTASWDIAPCTADDRPDDGGSTYL